MNRNLLQRKIVEALESGSLAFNDLKDRARMPKSTLSNVLKAMEDQGKIKRLVAPREEKGKKQRHYKILIQLMPAFTSPTFRTIEHLNKISDLVFLDMKKGKELLAPDVVKTILKTATLERAGGKWTSLEEMREKYKEFLINTFGSDEKIPENMKEDPYKTVPPCKLTDYLLLKALARYVFERGVVSDAIRGAKTYFMHRLLGTPKFLDLLTGKNLKEICQRKVENPEMFPVMVRVKKAGVSKEFNELLEWIKPLIKGENLAAHVFSQERTKHYRELFPIWRESYRAPHSRGEKVKGGDKSENDF